MMPHRTSRSVWPSRFAPLIARLAACARDDVTLGLAEIEAIIGGSLSNSAHVSLTYWTTRSTRLGRDLEAIGWRARLHVKEREVVFRRLG
jgi:hypothetical protein